MNAATFEDAVLAATREHPQMRVLVLACAGINAIDASGVETLRRIHRQLAGDERILALCGLKKQVIDVLERTGLWADLAPHATYRTEDDAVRQLLPVLGVVPPAQERRGLAW